MGAWIGFVGLAALGAWFRYNLNLSKASADISRAMAGGAVEPGLQDAITPPLLAFSYYVCFVATVAAYFGLPVFDDWSIVAVILAPWSWRSLRKSEARSRRGLALLGARD